MTILLLLFYMIFLISFTEQRKKIVLDGQTPYCPICGLTLRPGEVQGHLEIELEKIDKLSRWVLPNPK